jgi:hypothetical protein
VSARSPLVAAAGAAAVVAALLGAGSAQADIAGCPVFPATSAWNERVDQLPVAANSTTLIARMAPRTGLVPGFAKLRKGQPSIGFPYKVVGSSARRVRVKFAYADQSDKGPYPLPNNVPVETDGDHHVLVVDRSSCKLYELFGAARSRSRWTAGAGAIFDLRSDALRPAGWTSADAAGLPIFPGLVRADEDRAGAIDHALRFTLGKTRKSYIWPARHFGGGLNDAGLPPMGTRVRLRASFPVNTYPAQVQPILVAMQRYGMLLADNGPDWHVSGAPSTYWNDQALKTLGKVRGSDFEVVRTEQPAS